MVTIQRLTVVVCLAGLVPYVMAAGATYECSWEEAGGTVVLGSYGNASNPLVVTGGSDPGTNNEDPSHAPLLSVTPHSGNRMVQLSESPHSSTPQAYVAYIENLSEGDQVTASFWGWDSTPTATPSLRIWGHYAFNGDVSSYSGSAGGSSTYTEGATTGNWSQVAHTWTVAAGQEALVIEARLYSTPATGTNSTPYWIDSLQVIAPDTSTVTLPQYTPVTRHVSPGGSNTPPYRNWSSAAHVIQDAVDLSEDGERVLVAAGIYDGGGAQANGYSYRVVVTNATLLQSVTDRGSALIVGQGPKGASAVRCVHVSGGGTVAGFTLTNGFTHSSLSDSYGALGGGAWVDVGSTLSNCTVTGCSAVYGGGVLCLGGMVSECTICNNRDVLYFGGYYCTGGGMLTTCIVSNNSANNTGGGGCDLDAVVQDTLIIGNEGTVNRGGAACTAGGVIQRCTIISNTTPGLVGGADAAEGGTLANSLIMGNSCYNSGGGVSCDSYGVVRNCTIVRNTSTIGTGGLSPSTGATLKNCIIWDNTGGAHSNMSDSATGTFEHCCAAPTPTGSGHVTNAPGFVSATDFRLAQVSPCIDAGTNDAANGRLDLDRGPMPLDGDADGSAVIDIGCYERLTRGADSDGDTMHDGFEIDHGLDPTDGSDASDNPDNDPYINADEHTLDYDPNVSNDWFRITNITRSSPITVHFASSSNRVYALIGCSNLLDGVWTNVPGTAPKQGTGGADALTDTNAPPLTPLYRLRVSVPE